MSIAYEFTSFESPEQQERIEAILAVLEDLLPAWVRRVRVIYAWNTGDYADTRAMITPLPEYLSVTLRIFPIFFAAPRGKQVRMLLHEVCHTMTAPWNDWFHQDVLPFVERENPALARVLRGQCERHWERATEEMTWTLERRLGVADHHGEDAA